MDLRNCPECGKLYVNNNWQLCQECRQKELDEEDKVAQFLRDVAKASIAEICQATGVKEKIVLRMIKRGRVTGDVEISYPCEHCGQLITNGLLCVDCNSRLLNELSVEPKKEWQPDNLKLSQRRNEKMYTGRVQYGKD